MHTYIYIHIYIYTSYRIKSRVSQTKNKDKCPKGCVPQYLVIVTSIFSMMFHL